MRGWASIVAIVLVTFVAIHTWQITPGTVSNGMQIAAVGGDIDTSPGSNIDIGTKPVDSSINGEITGGSGKVAGGTSDLATQACPKSDAASKTGDQAADIKGCPTPTANQVYSSQYKGTIKCGSPQRTIQNLYGQECYEIVNGHQILGTCVAEHACKANKEEANASDPNKTTSDASGSGTVGTNPAGTSGTDSGAGSSGGTNSAATQAGNSQPDLGQSGAEQQPASQTAGSGSAQGGTGSSGSGTGGSASQTSGQGSSGAGSGTGSAAGSSGSGKSGGTGQSTVSPNTASNSATIRPTGSSRPSASPGYGSTASTPPRSQSTFTPSYGSSGSNGGSGSGKSSGGFSGFVSTVGSAFSPITSFVGGLIAGFAGSASSDQPAQQPVQQVVQQRVIVLGSSQPRVITVKSRDLGAGGTSSTPSEQNAASIIEVYEPSMLDLSSDEEAKKISEIASKGKNNYYTGDTPTHGNSETSASSSPIDRFASLVAQNETAAPPYANGVYIDPATGLVMTGAPASSSTSTLSEAEQQLASEGDTVATSFDFQTFASSFTGNWAYETHSPLRNKVALAFAQAQYDAIKAQIGALTEAASAGLCDDSCVSALVQLQSQVSERQSHIEDLRDMVQQDETLVKSAVEKNVPAPTLQMTNAANQWVNAHYASHPELAAQSPVAQIRAMASMSIPAEVQVGAPGEDAGVFAGQPSFKGIIDENATSSDAQGTVENVVVRTVRTVWNFIRSFFSPGAPAPETPAATTTAAASGMPTSTRPGELPLPTRTNCSLFSSIFLGCR